MKSEELVRENFKQKIALWISGFNRSQRLKEHIRHYFDEVSHDILISILSKKVNDKKLIALIVKVLKNHSDRIGMPLGNMTSQFFANVYLNELDQFVKHELKARYYLRYVDDFIILDANISTLEAYKRRIDVFLKQSLNLHLHPTKSKIMLLQRGIGFLGFRNFVYHRLLRKANILRMRKQLFDRPYDELCVFLEGWLAYANNANTFNLRKSIGNLVESLFPGNISLLQIDRLLKIKRVET